MEKKKYISQIKDILKVLEEKERYEGVSDYLEKLDRENVMVLIALAITGRTFLNYKYPSLKEIQNEFDREWRNFKDKRKKDEIGYIAGKVPLAKYLTRALELISDIEFK